MNCKNKKNKYIESREKRTAKPYNLLKNAIKLDEF